MALTDNLISYWKGYEASGDLLDAVGSNIGTDHNSVGSGPGIISGARTFNGSNQYFNVPWNSSIQLGDIDVTFTCWVKFSTAPSGSQAIFSLINAAMTQWSIELYAQTDSWLWYCENAGGYFQPIVSSTILSGVWYFIAGVHDAAANEARLYVNAGTPAIVTNSGGLRALTDGNLYIGQELSGTAFVNGSLAEMGFWKRALSGAEIASLYNSGAGLAYPFGSGSGNITAWIRA